MLFDHNCLICGIAQGRRLCLDCLSLVKFVNGQRCAVCSLPLGEKRYCLDCKGQNFVFSKTLAAAKYEGVVKDIIHQIKFSKQIYMFGAVKELASLYLRQLRCIRADLIIPVPFNITSLIVRGFDLPAELSCYLGRLLNIQVAQSAVIRRISKPQRFLARERRKENVINCFVVRDKSKIRFKKILVVDDIMSTGSTVNELSKTLLKTGAKEVSVFVLARR